MTPQEALAQALHAAAHAPYCECRAIEVDRERAAAILDALPEGCYLHTPETMAAFRHRWRLEGAQQERERLRDGLVELPMWRSAPDGVLVYTAAGVDDLLSDPEDES